jgi:hypothetical protein
MKLRTSKYITISLFNKALMKKIIEFLVLLLCCNLCFSQTTIDLKIIPFEIKNQNFYIDKIFDDRQEIYLGLVENSSGKKVQLHFQSSIEATIKQFMEATLPQASNRTPINLRINDLKIEQAQTSIDKRTARVYIELSFYSENGEELHKVIHYEDQVFPVSDLTEIYETHEKRVRAALEYCLWSFINNQKVNTTNHLIIDGMLDNPGFSSDASTFQHYVPLGKWYNMLTYKRMTDRYNEGWSIAYTGFSDHEKDLIIPFTLAYGQSRAKLDLVQERGYSSVNTFALGFGFNGYIKIIPGLYVDLGLNIPVGMEVLRDLADKKSSNFLIGISANQGMKIIPWKDFGIVIGAGLFQRWQTSKTENRNFGFELELGLNF